MAPCRADGNFLTHARLSRCRAKIPRFAMPAGLQNGEITAGFLHLHPLEEIARKT